jgi:GH35 family endo-1,4-beta-xylanase
MKWYATDKEGAAFDFEAGDKLLDWADKHAMRMRGHCLFWDRQKFVQPWVDALAAKDLQQQMEQRLQRLLGHYADRVTCWDANNEMLDGGFFADKLGDDICAWIFREAARLSPRTPLFVNEFAILGNEEKTARYVELVARLREQGAPVGGIGIQEHACERLLVGDGAKTAADETIERVELLPVSYAQAMQALDTMAAFGLPIHLTEISSKHADPERAADGREALYRIGFSHPGVELILLWGFWEKAHWLGRQAALVGADWEVLPAGQRLKRLLLEEWHTSVRAPLVGGAAAFRGFYGSYEVLLQLPNGQTSTHEVRFDRGQTTADIQLK